MTDVWSLVQANLFPVPSTNVLFNPYRDRHDGLDRPDAVAIRQDNLRRYLETYEERPPLFLLAEAPGPWGCRFSGVPLVSESQFIDDSFPLSGSPSSLSDEPHREYSASIYWRTLAPYFPHFFTWNTVPLHPHKPDKPLTIRTPRAAEVRAFAEILEGLLTILKPERVLAIGRKAEGALQRLNVACTYIRHPSQGGAVLFAEGVQEVIQGMDLKATL